MFVCLGSLQNSGDRHTLFRVRPLCPHALGCRNPTEQKPSPLPPSMSLSPLPPLPALPCPRCGHFQDFQGVLPHPHHRDCPADPHNPSLSHTSLIYKNRRRTTRSHPTMTSPDARHSRNGYLASRNSACIPSGLLCPRTNGCALCALQLLACDTWFLWSSGSTGELRAPVVLPAKARWRYALSITRLESRSARLISRASIRILCSLSSFLVVLWRCAAVLRNPQFVGHRAYARCSTVQVML
jgi:hypothetical protein